MKNYPLVVVGAGAGGLVVAIGAAKAGKKVLLIEKGTYGGDCTHYGCIPSKTLISLAEKAWIKGAPSGKEFQVVKEKVEYFLSHENPKALENHGVETLTGTARFTSRTTLDVSGETIGFKRLVLATGSSPAAPPIEGLSETPYLTNETLFKLKKPPETLAIIGGGPIGLEMAQAFNRLGTRVFVFEAMDSLLANEEKEAGALVKTVLTEEGVTIYLKSKIEKIEEEKGQITLFHEGKKTVCEKLLVAAGRKANTESLNLEKAGIAYDKSGIKTDLYGRTCAKNIFAIGDCAGPPFFTHYAEIQGRGVLTNLLAPWPIRFKIKENQALSRVTFTDPEVASIGLSEAKAIKTYGENKIKTYFLPLSEVDRAIASGSTHGFFKIVTKKWSSKILGATIACPRGGEVLGEIATAMYGGIPLRKLAQMIHPYPVFNRGIRKCADKWPTETILKEVKKWFGRS